MLQISNELKKEFIESYNKLAEIVTNISESKGWTIKEGQDAEKIALMHSELSEALEALRHGNPPDNHIPQFLGTEAEFADCMIRQMHYGFRRGLRIAEAAIAKIEYNDTREYQHGGKLF